MKNIKCFDGAGCWKQTAYDKAQALLRTSRKDPEGRQFVCTVWLWENQGHIFTNQHCFSSQARVSATTLMLGLEVEECDARCSVGVCKVAATIPGSNVTFITADAMLDYALLKINANKVSSYKTFGYLRIQEKARRVEDKVYIPQHPRGGFKRIVVTDDDNDKSGAKLTSVDYSVKVNGKQLNNLVAYIADTSGGSSGSPVVSRATNAVVGLHRIGQCENAATRSDILAAALKADLKGERNGGFASCVTGLLG